MRAVRPFLRGLAAVFLLGVGAVLCAQERPNVVKVGFFPFDGFHEISSDGVYSGYGYEYLQEIALYTGWEFEYIVESWDVCLKLLEEGKIDLLGSVQYTAERATVYDFASMSSGVSHVALFCRAENNNFAYEDYQKFDGMTVGLLEGNSRNDQFFAYCTENRFSMRPVMFKTQDALLAALHGGAVDAIVLSTVRKTRGERIVAEFNPSPFYYVTTKGNSRILGGLNDALGRLKTANPYYDAELYQKYYVSDRKTPPVFSRAEFNYIEEKQEVRGVYNIDLAPLEYVVPVQGEYGGVLADVFELISAYSGLEFDFIPVTSFIDATDRVKTGEQEVLFCMSHDYNWAADNNLYLSNSFASFPVVVIANRNKSLDEGSRVIALCENLPSSKIAIEQNPGQPIVFYKSVRECFESVRSGKADVTFVNSCISSLYLAEPRYVNLYAAGFTNFNEEFSIGISRDSDPLLVSIINKSLNGISETMFNEIVMKNTRPDYSMTIADLFYLRPLRAVLLIVGIFLGIVAVLVYVIWLKNKSNRSISELLYRDSVTGLWSFEKFRIEAERILKSDTSNRFALLYIDIERFKYINDTFGYTEGDRVLALTARTLKQFTASPHCFARIFADNFVILSVYTDKEEFQMRIARLRAELEAIPEREGLPYALVFFGGIYYLTENERMLYPGLDLAHYAKDTTSRMNAVDWAVYDEKIRRTIGFEKDLESRMKSALSRNEFVPYFQAKVDIMDKSITGAEALVRWKRADGGVIPPGEFLPFFEKNGFIMEIDFYIYENVCKKLRNWLDGGLNVVPVSCNFSRLHIRNPNFVERLTEIAASYLIPTELIEIEMTETIAMEDAERVAAYIARLRAAGFKIAIDDFGAGYSSLGLLQEFPIDVLKLDKIFIQKGLDGKLERGLIGALVKVAGENDISVVCEGIETPEQESLLKELNCRVAQGYLYAMPVPAEAFEKMIEKGQTR